MAQKIVHAIVDEAVDYIIIDILMEDKSIIVRIPKYYGGSLCVDEAEVSLGG